MQDAVAPETSATAPQERGWRWFVFSLVLMVVTTAAPEWPSALALAAGVIRLLLPVEQFALLVLIGIASCACVGWWAGGRGFLALLWLVVAVWVVWQIPLPHQGYGSFVRGWSVTMGAAFGLVCLGTRARPFFGRALSAVALTAVVTVVGIAEGSNSVASGTGQAGRGYSVASAMLSTEYQQRLNESLRSWRERTNSDAWKTFVRRMPDAAARADNMADFLSGAGEYRGASGAGWLLVLSPALLGIETLLALALGWAAYHRLSRVRIGPPLSELRLVRFNDQLIWGLVVGGLMLFLPTLTEWRAIGANLALFFGLLYALRGAGVLRWLIPDRFIALAVVVVVLMIPLLGVVWLLLTVLAVTFALGLGDTWRDFRASAEIHRPSSFQ